MSRPPSDIAPLLAKSPMPAVRYSQGTVIRWDPNTFRNAIQWRNNELVDLPVIGGIDALGFREGDTVGLFGWDAAGRRGATQWWVMGRAIAPGEDSPDVIIRGSLIAVVDDEDQPRVVIAKSSTGGGHIATYHANGQEHILIGEITTGGTNVGQGVLAQSNNGVDIFNAFNNPITGQPQFRVFDANGDLLVYTDKYGKGMDRPYMDVAMYPINSNMTAQWNGGTWQTIWMGRMYVTHPALHIQARTWTTDGANPTTGQVRALVNGNQIGSIENIGNTTQFVDFGSTEHDISGETLYNFMPIELQARITGGDGHISTLPYGVTKKGLT